MRPPLLPVLLLGLIAGSTPAGAAGPGKPWRPPPLPSAEEVAAYVTAHWPDDFGPVFATSAGRRGEASTLLRVEKMVCGYRHIAIACTFEAAARFASGEEPTQTMSSDFDRKPDGSLESVIVVYDRRIGRR